MRKRSLFNEKTNEERIDRAKQLSLGIPDSKKKMTSYDRYYNNECRSNRGNDIELFLLRLLLPVVFSAATAAATAFSRSSPSLRSARSSPDRAIER
jgi:hypothetical protein